MQIRVQIRERSEGERGLGVSLSREPWTPCTVFCAARLCRHENRRFAPDLSYLFLCLLESLMLDFTVPEAEFLFDEAVSDLIEDAFFE